MCRFCVEHGEGERWYLSAKNYAYDLASDLDRRQYVIDFARGFDSARATAITIGEVLGKLPAPLARAGSGAISRHMQHHHFGQPVPLEECERILEMATSITVIPCICRLHAPGARAEEVCVLVTTTPVADVIAEGFRDYANGPDLDDFRTVGRDEALELLRGCEERGLMHSVWTFETPFTMALCNCNLESGCLAMRMTAGYGVKLMWRGEWVATLDAERCRRCAKCARACPFSAIDASRSGVTIHAERCWGCGVCRAHCASDAITLVDRREIPAVANLW